MTTAPFGNYTLRLADPKTYTDDEIDRGTDFANAQRREFQPDDPTLSYELGRTSLRARDDKYKTWGYRVVDADGTVVAGCGWTSDPEDDNPELLSTLIAVLPDHRRTGIGSQLLAELVALADQQGRTRFLSSTADHVESGEAFARAVGGEPKLVGATNHLLLDDLDADLMAQWRDDGPRRAADYDLLRFEDEIPDEFAEAYCDVVMALNDMPLDDLDMNDFTMSVDELRTSEKTSREVGTHRRVVVARHRATGEFVGYHDMYFNAGANETVAFVGGTAVRDAHRGHALGKWLKADMMERVLTDWPTVTEIRTENADSNDAMLGINTAMGYKVLHAEKTWEFPVEAVRSWLADRGVTALLDPTLH